MTLGCIPHSNPWESQNVLLSADTFVARTDHWRKDDGHSSPKPVYILIMVHSRDDDPLLMVANQCYTRPLLGRRQQEGVRRPTMLGNDRHLLKEHTVSILIQRGSICSLSYDRILVNSQTWSANDFAVSPGVSATRHSPRSGFRQFSTDRVGVFATFALLAPQNLRVPGQNLHVKYGK